jgi:hypothetical protein
MERRESYLDVIRECGALPILHQSFVGSQSFHQTQDSMVFSNLLSNGKDKLFQVQTLMNSESENGSTLMFFLNLLFFDF